MRRKYFTHTMRMISAAAACLLSGLLLAGSMLGASDREVFSAKAEVYLSAQSDQREELSQALFTGMKEMKREVDLRAFHITPDELQEAIGRLLLEQAELFHINQLYHYACQGDTGFVSSVFFTYKYSQGEYALYRKLFENTAGALLAQVEPGWSDLEKALFLHDSIVAQYAYDLYYKNADVYSFITEGTGVCQAYTLYYGYLLTCLGIENQPVVSKSMNHVWNQVKIEGQYYHVDLTWDDPVLSEINAGVPGRVAHKYFLLSDEKLGADHEDYTAPYPCASSRFDERAWQKSNARFVFASGGWYCYMNGCLYSYDSVSDTLRSVYETGDVWPVLDRPGAYYTESYSGLAAYGGRLIFNSPSAVYAYDIKTGEIECLYTLTNPQSMIVGTNVNENRLLILMGSSPNTLIQTEEISITLEKETDDSPTSGDAALPFEDVEQSDWFYSAVEYVYQNHLMAGLSTGVFAPELPTSRAMLVQVLYNMENRPTVQGATAFADVNENDWYAAAVLWAYQHQLVAGITKDYFGAEQHITREQFAAILYRYAAYKKMDVSVQADLSVYSDDGKVSPYARPALSWARAKGYMTGHAGTSLIDPAGQATRAQMASILMRFEKDR